MEVNRDLDALKQCGHCQSNLGWKKNRDLYDQTLIVIILLLSLSVFGILSMLPGVYIVKFDMLNPNLRSKITKYINQNQTHRKSLISIIQQ